MPGITCFSAQRRARSTTDDDRWIAAPASTGEPSMRCDLLGDQAVMAYAEDEKQATILTALIRRHNPSWLIDVVQAYTSVAIYYDSTGIDCFQVMDWLAHAAKSEASEKAPVAARSHVIPC